MADIQWTQSQLDAVAARGGTLLVCAAAGSGKTAVLTGRVLRLLTDSVRPVRADRLLIVTFSNAAAAEMKERIERALAEAAARSPDDLFLQEQQVDLQRAAIGTIHKFCLGLVRGNFQHLGLSADLRVADERELDLLRAQTLREAVEERYEEGDPLFLRTVELFSSTRSDARLWQTVLRLYDFTRSHPFPDQWLEEKLALYDENTPVEETVWGEEILSHARGVLSLTRDGMRDASAIIAREEKLAAAYAGAFASDMGQLDAAIAALDARDWDGAVHCLRAFSFEKLRPLRGYGDDETKARLLGVRKSEKEVVERLRTRAFCATREQFREDIGDLRAKIEQLFSLVRDFAGRFDAAKRERQILDFADLEQYALRLLCTCAPQGGAEPTPLAKRLREEYDAIMIDEYQDTNEAQEMLFSSLSNGSNLFMVGDVKQSIYGFRQANPLIFTRKKEEFCVYDGNAFPAKIILGANFRSHPLVCGSVNALFGACMSKTVGQLEYGPEEQLIPLGTFRAGTCAGVSLEIVDITDSGETAAQAEARYVAASIARMLAARERICDKGETRAIRPGDIGILLRSPKGKAEIYLKALADRGIAGFSGTQSTFLQTVEISTVISILKAVSNPLGDIPLVSAAMSPVYALSAGDVARIRLYRRDAPFYMALLEGGARGDSGCTRLLEDLKAFRRAASHMGAARLLRHIYESTALLPIVSALENPEGRAANLRLLVEYAKTFERGGYRTVSQFLRFLDSVEENGKDLAPANLSGIREDAVRVMSIHRSKGLEFPVVFVCDCAKRFNRDDLRRNVLLHSEMGFACMRRDGETVSQFTTVPLEALRLRCEREMAGEEMRVLYVALTRAKERLILTAACENPARRLALLQTPPDSSGKLPAHAVARAQGVLDWLAMAALASPQGAPLREYAGLPEPETLAPCCEMACSVVLADEVPTAGREEGDALPPGEAEGAPALRERIQECMGRKYRFAPATVIPTKMAVTALAGSREENGAHLFTRQPQFITRQKLTAAMRGDAFHKFMLFADHPRARANPSAEILRLVARGFLSRDEGEAVAADHVAAFYRCDLYGRIQAAECVEREYRFIAQLGRDELEGLFPDMGDEVVTVQGICDLLFFEEGQAVIVDYKTDKTDGPLTLILRYRRQVELYARILARVLGVRVKECILYSTALSEEIPMPLADPLFSGSATD